MTKLEIAKKVIDSNGGIARTADFIMAGLAKYEICNLNNEGHLARIRHGYYKLANNYDITEEQVLKTLLPEGIVCVESALFTMGTVILHRGFGLLQSQELYPERK